MYQLIIAEKTSVAQSIAAVLGAKRRDNGYLDTSYHGISAIWPSLPAPKPTTPTMPSGAVRICPSCRCRGALRSAGTSERSLTFSKP